MDFPPPVGATTSAWPDPPSRARTASRCQGRKPGRPNLSCSFVSRSVESLQGAVDIGRGAGRAIDPGTARPLGKGGAPLFPGTVACLKSVVDGAEDAVCLVEPGTDRVLGASAAFWGLFDRAAGSVATLEDLAEGEKWRRAGGTTFEAHVARSRIEFGGG